MVLQGGNASSRVSPWGSLQVAGRLLPNAPDSNMHYVVEAQLCRMHKHESYMIVSLTFC